jgi:ubiquinol-cytochrome c reductase cytochrome b subunit
VLFFVLYYHGGEFGAPADPSEPYSAARPEWYFLFLFQFLKYFPGTTEIWGALFFPGLVMAILFAMPFIGRWKLGHRFNIGFSFALLAGAALLTYLAVNADQKNTIYRNAVADAERSSERVRVLAESPKGIPPTGAASLLHDDAFIQGPRLFAQNCASCHRYGGTDGLGVIPKGEPQASDLKGFASRAWLTGLLDPAQVASLHYFGGTAFKDGKMVKFVKDDVSTFSAEEKAALVKVIAAVSAEAQLPAQKALDARDAAVITEGRKLITTQISCTDCHQFREPAPDLTAPDLTGYGSREWLTSFLTDPAQHRFYGTRNDRMPAFGKSGMLDPHAMGLIADWLRGDWYEPATTATQAK